MPSRSLALLTPSPSPRLEARLYCTPFSTLCTPTTLLHPLTHPSPTASSRHARTASRRPRGACHVRLLVRPHALPAHGRHPRSRPQARSHPTSLPARLTRSAWWSERWTQGTTWQHKTSLNGWCVRERARKEPWERSGWTEKRRLGRLLHPSRLLPSSSPTLCQRGRLRCTRQARYIGFHSSQTSRSGTGFRMLSRCYRRNRQPVGKDGEADGLGGLGTR